MLPLHVPSTNHDRFRGDSGEIPAFGYTADDQASLAVVYGYSTLIWSIISQPAAPPRSDARRNVGVRAAKMPQPTTRPDSTRPRRSSRTTETLRAEIAIATVDQLTRGHALELRPKRGLRSQHAGIPTDPCPRRRPPHVSALLKREGGAHRRDPFLLVGPGAAHRARALDDRQAPQLTWRSRLRSPSEISSRASRRRPSSTASRRSTPTTCASCRTGGAVQSYTWFPSATAGVRSGPATDRSGSGRGAADRAAGLPRSARVRSSMIR